jgi:hypothetical protein
MDGFVIARRHHYVQCRDLVKSIKMPDDIFSSHFVAASLRNASQ